MTLLALCVFLQQQAPDPNQKEIITIVQPAPPPNSAPSPSRDQGRSVSDPPKEPPAVGFVSGWGLVANAAALREHIKSAKKPEASGDGIIGLRLAITGTGAVRKIDVTVWKDPLLRAAVLKAAETWTFHAVQAGRRDRDCADLVQKWGRAFSSVGLKRESVMTKDRHHAG